MKKLIFIVLGCLAIGGLAYSIEQKSLPSAYVAESRPAFYKEIIHMETKKGKKIPFRVEVAKTRHQLAYGLMFKKHMENDEGMIFFYKNVHKAVFWMKNTYIPLDMIFIKDDGRVVQIEHGVPLSLDHIHANTDVRYVLELNAGQAKAQGIEIGSKLLLP